MSLPAKIGKYEILRRIGKGAMGEVFLGQDPLLGRQVAIKTIQAGSSFEGEARARFEREARATAALNHPNIVTVFEYGEAEGLHYLVMEFVEGEDLELLIHKGDCGKAELLELLAQTCEGLAYAHERGIIHRDLKPANVLVKRQGKRLQAKLSDFGVALVDRSTLTEQDVRMGTVSYMAPEYLDTGRATVSTDLFAVGVMLYEVLSGGQRPFVADTPAATLNAILRAEPAPLDVSRIRDLPPAILELCRKALCKDPEGRFPDAETLAAAIREALEAPAQTLSGAHRLPADAPIVVGKGGHVLSLRVALRQAPPGGTIRVLPGCYREALSVGKDVTLEGEGEGVILALPEDASLVVHAGRVTLRKVLLRREGASEAPLLQLRAGRLLLEDLQVEGGAVPLVRAEAGTALELRKVHLRGASAALHLKPGARAELEDCAVACASGLRLDGGSHAQLLRSRLEGGGGLGLQLAPASQAVLEDCALEAFGAGGAELEADARLKLVRCSLRGPSPVGVLVLEKAQAVLEDCAFEGHRDAAVHVAAEATAQLRRCRLHRNAGYGLSLLGPGMASAVDCEVSANGEAGVLIHRGATVQLKGCRLLDGGGVGVACAKGGQGVLDGCEIAGNAGSGARVEPGGSLLLVRCTLRDGRASGLLLFEEAEATLEACVVHRNARGGILLAKDASDPVLREGNRLDDALFREDAAGGLVKIAPLRRS